MLIQIQQTTTYQQVRSYKMAITFTLKTNDLGIEYIEMLDSDKLNWVATVPKDPANTDYQAYLAAQEALANGN
jgi:hypothetical protein